VSSPPTPGDPNAHSSPPTWSKEMSHHHRNAALPSRRPCSPPSRAAAPASADSRPCNEIHHAACKVLRVGTVETRGQPRNNHPEETVLHRRRQLPTGRGSRDTPGSLPGRAQIEPVKSPPPRCYRKDAALPTPLLAPSHLNTSPRPAPTSTAEGRLPRHARSWPPQARLAHGRPRSGLTQRAIRRGEDIVGIPAAKIRRTASQRTTPPAGGPRPCRS
jgi:hypothetical protein